MHTDIAELRKGDRFVFTDPLPAMFIGTEVSILNISLEGVQILHPQLLRLGTHGHLQFRSEDAIINVNGRVLWSHLSQTESGTVYRSGLALDEPDHHFAAAVNAFFRTGSVHRDDDSLDRKRVQMEQREERRKSQPYLAPVVVPPLDEPTG
jgi:hypothetical protein